MLKRIELCYDHRRFVRGIRAAVFTSGINLVIGPNGSGKSSLLRAISSCRDCRRFEEGPTRYHYYDGELMNPHRGGTKVDSLLAVRAMFSSHGETMRDVLASIPLRRKDTLVLDEPESGQDIEWLARIKRGFSMVEKRGCQLIVATHHPIFMGDFPTVELRRGYRKKLFAIYRELLGRDAEDRAV
jgi:predicted ATPase